jgi:hypothetical protein
MTGDPKPQDIKRPLAKLLESGVEFVHGSLEGLDLPKQQVKTTAGTLGYDYLIVALGADLAPEAVPGLKEAAETFYTFEGALRLRDALSRFSSGKVAIAVAAMPYKCPGAPHEGAMLIANYLRKRDCLQKRGASVHAGAATDAGRRSAARGRGEANASVQGHRLPMVIEGADAIGSGVIAHSLLLVSFGIITALNRESGMAVSEMNEVLKSSRNRNRTTATKIPPMRSEVPMFLTPVSMKLVGRNSPRMYDDIFPLCRGS